MSSSTRLSAQDIPQLNLTGLQSGPGSEEGEGSASVQPSQSKRKRRGTAPSPKNPHSVQSGPFRRSISLLHESEQNLDAELDESKLKKGRLRRIFSTCSPRSPKEGMASARGLKAPSPRALQQYTAEQVAALSLGQLRQLARFSNEQEESGLCQLEAAQLGQLRTEQWSIVLPALRVDVIDAAFAKMPLNRVSRIIEMMHVENLRRWMGPFANAPSLLSREDLESASKLKLRAAFLHFWRHKESDLIDGWNCLQGLKKSREHVLKYLYSQDILSLAPYLEAYEAERCFESLERLSERKRLIEGLDPEVLNYLRAQVSYPPRHSNGQVAAVSLLAVVAMLEAEGPWAEDSGAIRDGVAKSRILWCPRENDIGTPSKRVKILTEHLRPEHWKQILLHMPLSRIEDLRRQSYLSAHQETATVAKMTLEEFLDVKSRGAINQRLVDDWRSLQQMAFYHENMQLLRDMQDQMAVLEERVSELSEAVRRKNLQDVLLVDEEMRLSDGGSD